jgi:hypothetical protein
MLGTSTGTRKMRQGVIGVLNVFACMKLYSRKLQILAVWSKLRFSSLPFFIFSFFHPKSNFLFLVII